MNLEEIEKKITELEADWQIYHRDTRNHSMPDMMLLTKLRAERKRIIQGL